MSTIKCTECGHENETQRVYCHSCGARLDRSSLIEEAQKPQKPVRKDNVGPFFRAISGGVGALLKTVFFAVLAAGLFQAARPPDGVPVDQKKIGANLVDAPSLSIDLEQASLAPRRIGYSEAQLNAYLKSRVKPPKNPAIPTWAVSFDQAFINLQPGTFRLSKKFLVFSLPFYVGGSYIPLTEGGQFKVKNVGGNVGSLPLPSLVFDPLDHLIFGEFVKNMKEEADAASKMQSFEVNPKMVVITSGKN